MRPPGSEYRYGEPRLNLSTSTFKQGSKVLVEGRLRPDPETGGPNIWTRNDGSPGSNFEITAQNVLFLSSRTEDQAYQASEPGGTSEPVDEDDIPF